jgi:hypothetical protein
MSSSCLQGQVRFGGVVSLHSGIEFGQRRTGEGSSGGGEEGGGVRSGSGAARTFCVESVAGKLSRSEQGRPQTGPSYFFISLVLGPLNSLVWYVPSLRYTRGRGWRIHCGVEVTESSTNKQHHHRVQGLSTHPLVYPCPFLLLGIWLILLFCFRDFHVRCSCTPPHSWELTASVCIIHLCSVFPAPPPFSSSI